MGYDPDRDFAEQFNAALKRRKLRDKFVCRHFNISKATILRWKAGMSAPHPNIREFIMSDLEKIRH